MVIELAGIPGSGKSTCEALLRAALEERGVPVLGEQELRRRYQRDRIYQPWRVADSLRTKFVVRALAYLAYRRQVLAVDLRNRLAGGCLFGAVAREQRLACQWLAEDMLLTDYYRRTAVPPLSPEVYLMPEGLVQHTAGVPVWATERYRDISRRWLAGQDLRDLTCLYVQTPLDVAADRLWQRGAPRSWPRRATQSQTAVRNILERFQASLEHSLQQFQAAGARVVAVDNSHTTNRPARAIAELVDSLDPSGNAVTPETSGLRSS